MNLRWLPNAITIARMVAALPLLWLMLRRDFAAAFWLALFAGVSDALDGTLAKRFDWRTRSGALLDPLADKLLLCASFFGLWLGGALPGWIVALVFGRDGALLAGSLTWWRKIGAFVPEPSLLGKFTTFAQIVFVAAVLLQWGGIGALPAAVWPVLIAVVALATLVSGLDYVLRYGVRAFRHFRSLA
jgi:cardiolipin synthase